jgi:oligosaccharide reducing-end xylanase
MNTNQSKFPLLAVGLSLSLWAACSTNHEHGAGVSAENGQGAYATGHYRNLFVEAGHPPQEVQARVEACFNQLFHGNPTNQAVYYEAGSNSNGPLAYITDIKHHDVRTEGLSYGMIIAAEMNKKAEFDALWNWSNTYLYHAATNDPGYGFFAWQARTNGARMSQSIAPDGEQYYVMALYFAAGRWGNGQGLYNYKAQADELLHRMIHRGLITGAGGRGGSQTWGPLFDVTNKMALFTPAIDRNPLFTDPSYHLPAFYELWSRWGPAEDHDYWAAAAQASRDLFAKVVSPVTGLNPYLANFDGSPYRGRGGTNFSYDAFRTAGNWSVDWSWWGKDVRERAMSDHLQAFFESKGMTNYGDQYTLDGRQLEGRHAQGLVAVNAETSLAATDPGRSKEFVEALWDTPVPDGLERYYEGLLYLMGLLHCSGEFRIWAPH